MNDKEPQPPRFPNRVKEWHRRNKPDMSQPQFARAIGMSNGYIHKLERGERKLQWDMAVKIANVFGCNPADLQPTLAVNEMAILAKAHSPPSETQQEIGMPPPDHPWLKITADHGDRISALEREIKELQKERTPPVGQARPQRPKRR